MARARAWCFTLNNWTPEEGEHIRGIDCRYIIVGNEVGENGTPHLQGFVSFGTAMRFAAVKLVVGERCHLEPAKGSAQQNRDYCSKQLVWFENGEIPHAGKRTDITAVKEALAQTGRMSDVIAIATSYQALRAGELLLKYINPMRDKNVPRVVRWFYGPPGSGKTRAAFAEAGPDTWASSVGLRWFDGYDGHASAIFDDYRPDACAFNYFLRLLDRYPVRVEFKGGSRPFVSTSIWITSILPPADLVPFGEPPEQLLRRITEIRCFPAGTPSGTEVGGNTGPRPEPCAERKEP